MREHAFRQPQQSEPASARGRHPIRRPDSNDHPDIRELFAGFRTIELELAYSISREKTGKASRELAICNW